jgi:hypothetical protein
MILNHFDMLLLKKKIKNKIKYYFDVFLSQKYFKNRPLSYSQTPLNTFLRVVSFGRVFFFFTLNLELGSISTHIFKGRH